MALNEALRHIPQGEEVDENEVDEVHLEPQVQRRGRPPHDNVPNPPPPPPRVAHRVLPNEGYARGFFTGAPRQNAYKHIKGFADTCWGSKQTNVSEDALRLSPFPFSLRGKALDWLERLPNHSITTWDELDEKFIAKFFSSGHIATLRDEILAFKQEPNEPLHEIWERYWTMVKECPNNDMTEAMIQQTFYRGRIESMFKQMMERNVDSDAQIASYNTSIHNLEVQMGQISQALNTVPKGALPSDTVVNPKGGNNTGHAMAVTTRSSRGGVASSSNPRKIVNDDVVVQEEDEPKNDENVNDEVRIDIDENVEEIQEDMNPSREHVIDIPDPVVPKAKAPLPRPLPPYPQRLAKQNNENQFKKFIDMMKILSINVPLVEALEQMPGYAKFIEDLVKKKRSMNCETIKMTHQTLGIGQPRPTSMRLQMADRTMKRSLGIIDDVLVRIDKFILPIDFVILDCEVDYEVLVILGRPFLATGNALVDVEDGKLTFWVGDEKVVFYVCKSMRQPNSSEVCSFVDLVTEVIVDDTSAMINMEDPLEAVLLNHDED
ncbi:uncharacterized protein [Nicotiana tomentosiformis]|uniref:uncharacterized protein n=1 Tax=Nicotiana tomentosiformis TaxID=4098 RepID=UPI00388C9715